MPRTPPGEAAYPACQSDAWPVPTDCQVPTITVAQFAPHYDETHARGRLGIGCPMAIAATTLVPEPRAVTGKAQFDAVMSAQDRNRPHGSGGQRRKPRRA